VNIRPLQRRDLEEVLAIEQSAMAHPWSAAQLAAELTTANSIGLIAEVERRVQGYALLRTCRPECELLRLVVAGRWRRCGIGRTLLDHALRDLAGKGYATCFLEVRASNDEASRLYRTAGFFQVGIRKKYYAHPTEDGMQFRGDLINITGEKS
jgi:[ribosomal protein S18]-alanine N-acetyltransferase